MGHPVFARCYGMFSHLMEHEIGERREQLLAALRGRVLEVGCGNGMNFAHYPADVDEVVAVEPEPYLRHLAQRAADDAPVRVSIHPGVAEKLPFADDEFDAAIASLVLCSVTEQATALAEISRVLRPAGELRFLEHVRADDASRARIQASLDRSRIWPFLAGGCHCSRDTVASIDAAGFNVEHIDRFILGPSWMVANPVVCGVARPQ